MAEPAQDVHMQDYYRSLVTDNLSLTNDVLAAAESWLENQAQQQQQQQQQQKQQQQQRKKKVQPDNDGVASVAPPGLARLVRRLKAEREFLGQVLLSPSQISNSHAKSSNLAHLHALFLAARHARSCRAVLHRVTFLRTADCGEPLFIALSDEEDYSSDDDDDDDVGGGGGGGVDDGGEDEGARVGGGRSSGAQAASSPPRDAQASSYAEPTRGVETGGQCRGHSHGPAVAAGAAAAAAAAPAPMSPSAMERLLRERLRADLGIDYDADDSDEDAEVRFDGNDGGGEGDDCSSDEDDDEEEYPEDDEEEEDSLVVDVVADGGQAWLKVVARNPMSLHRACQGSSPGHRSILAQAQDLLCAAKQNRKDFVAPRIVIIFAKGVTQAVKDCLQSLDVIVCGSVCPTRDRQAMPGPAQGQPLTNGALATAHDTVSEVASAMPSSSPWLPDLDAVLAGMMRELSATLEEERDKTADRRVNLDVSTMLVLCSQLTHGHAKYIFKSEVLNEQACRERHTPALPALEDFLEGKELVCCQTARSEFTDIVSTVAGQTEKDRAKELMERVQVIGDCPSQRVLQLKESGKIRGRAKVIFGTGESLQLTTTTANMAFVRAAGGQGIHFSIFHHESRALTESKQVFAQPLPADHPDLKASED